MHVTEAVSPARGGGVERGEVVGPSPQISSSL